MSEATKKQVQANEMIPADIKIESNLDKLNLDNSNIPAENNQDGPNTLDRGIAYFKAHMDRELNHQNMRQEYALNSLSNAIALELLYSQRERQYMREMMASMLQTVQQGSKHPDIELNHLSQLRPDSNVSTSKGEYTISLLKDLSKPNVWYVNKRRDISSKGLKRIARSRNSSLIYYWTAIPGQIHVIDLLERYARSTLYIHRQTHQISFKNEKYANDELKCNKDLIQYIDTVIRSALHMSVALGSLSQPEIKTEHSDEEEHTTSATKTVESS